MPALGRDTGYVARTPRAVTAITSIRWLRSSRAHVTAASSPSQSDGHDDLLVEDAADLVAAAHVADGHEVGTHHAGQFGAWPRLSDLAQAAQSLQSIHAARRTDHVDSQIGARS